MTLEDILSALTPLLRDGESAAIAKSDVKGERMIALAGTTRKAGIYKYDDTYVWYSQPGTGSWPADDTDAMNEQLPVMLDRARTSTASRELRGRGAREMTPSDLVGQLPDLLAGGLPAGDGLLPNGTAFAEIDYPNGALHIERGPHTDFSAWAITHYHRWPTAESDLSQARKALTDILAAIKPAD